MHINEQSWIPTREVFKEPFWHGPQLDFEIFWEVLVAVSSSLLMKRNSTNIYLNEWKRLTLFLRTLNKSLSEFPSYPRDFLKFLISAWSWLWSKVWYQSVLIMLFASLSNLINTLSIGSLDITSNLSDASRKKAKHFDGSQKNGWRRHVFISNRSEGCRWSMWVMRSWASSLE